MSFGGRKFFVTNRGGVGQVNNKYGPKGRGRPRKERTRTVEDKVRIWMVRDGNGIHIRQISPAR